MTSWKPLSSFVDPAYAKLDNLRRAAAAGVRVPATLWCYAHDLPLDSFVPVPDDAPRGTLVIRTAVPGGVDAPANAPNTVVEIRPEFGWGVSRVLGAMPRDAEGRVAGVVFFQALVVQASVGIARTDGYYFERAVRPGKSVKEAIAQPPGDAKQGQAVAGDDWGEWIGRVKSALSDTIDLDLEWALDRDGYVLLQAVAAHGELRRNWMLSVVGDDGILGDPPSPWTAAVYSAAASDVVAAWGEIEPEIVTWGEPPFVEVAGQLYANDSLFWRWTDTLGLARSYAAVRTGQLPGTRSGGGNVARWKSNRMRALGLVWRAWRVLGTARVAFAKLDAQLGAARTLDRLFAAHVEAVVLFEKLRLAMDVLVAAFDTVRDKLRVARPAVSTVHERMYGLHALAMVVGEKQRTKALEGWVEAYGHFASCSGDVGHPRVREFGPALERYVVALPTVLPSEAPSLPPQPRGFVKLFAWADRKRAWLRDEILHRLAVLRGRILKEAAPLVEKGVMERADDVFLLREPTAPASGRFREVVTASRARREESRQMQLPLRGSRDALEELMAEMHAGEAQALDLVSSFPGKAYGNTAVEGPVVKVGELLELLARKQAIDPGSVLVVPALEATWVMVFPRFAAVVAERARGASDECAALLALGRTAVVDCPGVYRALRTGDRVRVDPSRALVQRLDAAAPAFERPREVSLVP